jgi:hypothetical protein
MFVVYCPAHRAEVLLPISRIERIDRATSRPGVDVKWRCWCGHRGRSAGRTGSGPTEMPEAS